MLNEEVTESDIAAVVSRWTGIPVDKMLEGEREKLLAMADSLRASVIGQEDAIVAIANAVRRAPAGLHAPNRPIGSFPFLGPTDAGKTELTKHPKSPSLNPHHKCAHTMPSSSSK